MSVSTVVVLLIAALFSFQSSNAQFVPCDFIRLTSCQGAFNDFLGINPTLDWKNVPALRLAVERLYETGGTNGLLNVCRALKGFKTCFNGPIGYNACISVIGLIIDGNFQSTMITPKQAYDYVKLFTQFDFACGAGMAPFLNNYSCMSTIFRTQNATLVGCVNAFDNGVANDGRQACTYASIAQQCYSQPFLTACGQQGGWWACEYERTGVSVAYPQCTNNYCQLITTS